MGTRESLRYGASDLKRAYNRNLGTALVLSIAFHGAIVALYLVCVNIGRAEPVLTERGHKPSGTYGPIYPLAPTILNEPSAGGPRVVRSGTPRVRSAGGTPVVSNDTSLISDLDVDIMTPGGGDGPAIGDMSLGGGGGIGDPSSDIVGTSIPHLESPKHHPELGDFVAVEKDAAWDPADLQRHITYPDIAARNNIQGTVVVRALIDEEGRVADTHVDHSDNQMLTDAALKAIRETRFTAATQNKIPTAVWVQIPVTFKLAN
ncbi:MAG: energy transducer TonB [Candidatus Kapaibacterium sp.]